MVVNRVGKERFGGNVDDGEKSICHDGNDATKTKELGSKVSIHNMSITVVIAFCGDNSTSSNSVGKRISFHESSLGPAFYISLVVLGIVNSSAH